LEPTLFIAFLALLALAEAVAGGALAGGVCVAGLDAAGLTGGLLGHRPRGRCSRFQLVYLIYPLGGLVSSN